MEPDQTPTPNTAGNLDPQAVNLAKAIRQTESGGNFQAQGKSGEYGAYQWMPGTWDAMSKSAGVNVPINQATPEQQNEVAYKQIESWKQQGYNPAQIASMWNAGSGNPDAYTGHFANGEPSKYTRNDGVQVDVPGYVNNVTSTYQKLKGATQQQQQIQQGQQQDQTNNRNAALAGGALLGGGIAATALTAGEDLWGEAGSILGDVGKGLGAWLGLGGNQNQSQDSGTSQQPQDNFASDIAQSGQATSTVKNAINEAMQGTQTNRTYAQSQTGQNGIQASAMFNLIHPDENGNLIYDSEKSKALEAELGNALDKQIEAQNKQVSPVSVLNYGGSYIGNDRFSTATDKKQAASHMQQMAKDDSGGRQQMSLSDMRTAQKAHYQAAKNSYGNTRTSSEKLAHKALGDAYGEVIRNNMEDKDLYDRTKKMQQALIHSKEIGKRLQGKKAPKQKGLWESFLRQGARAAEIYIGDRLGGPVGAIIGGLIGEGFNRKIDKKFGRNIFESKGMRAALDILKDSKPKEYRELVDALKKKGVEIPKTEEKHDDSMQARVKDVAKDEGVIRPLLGKEWKRQYYPHRGLISVPRNKQRKQ